MKKIELYYLFIMVIAINLTACKKDDVQISNDPIWGSTITTSINGRVVNSNGDPVPGAMVKSGSITAFTDPMGVFKLSGINANKYMGYITVDKPGYFQGSRSFIPNNSGNLVIIRLLNKALSGTISASSGGSVTDNGVTIDLPANGIVKNNQPYNGNVNVAIQYLNPSSPTFFEEMPGNLYAEMNGQAYGLKSYGMVAVELTDDNGNVLQIASGQTATINFPIPSSIQLYAPTIINLWYFDEINGYWKSEGTATRQGNQYIANVGHFSFWNCDVPFSSIILSGKFIDINSNMPLVGYVVKLNSVSLGTGSEITNAMGEFSGVVPVNEEFVLSLEYSCGNGIYSTLYTSHIGPFSSNTTLNTIAVSNNTSNTYSISGTIIDCNSNIVQNAYIILNNQLYFAPQGYFSISTCANNISIIPFATNPWTSGPVLNFALNNTGHNLGNISLNCGSTSAPISDIDGNVYQTVQIGTQLWMAENLNTSRYANGDLIPNLTEATQWENTTSGAWVDFNNNSQYENPYGKLYNWYALTDPRNVCPTGWHYANNADWGTLGNFATSFGAGIGGDLKSVGTQYWTSPNTGATNLFGFSALPGGRRFFTGKFEFVDSVGYFWIGNEIGSNADYSALYYYTASGATDSHDKNIGLSIRCVKD